MTAGKTKKILNSLKLDYVALSLLIAAHYTRLQWNDYIGDPDGFFHAKLASLLAHGHFLKSMPWMQFSSLRDNFTDQHLLYHLLQAPLTLINNDPLLGVKISAVIFATAQALVFYWLLKKFKISWPWFFSLLLIILPALSFRLSLIKITGLSLIMVWLLIYAFFQKKYKTLAALGFIYVWLYGGWPLAIFIFIIFYLADYIYAFIHHQKIKLFHNKIVIILNSVHERFDLKKLARYLLAGLFSGIIINPYFPQNIYAYYQQFFQIGLINKSGQFPVGGEWYGASFHSILASTSILIFIMASIIFVLLFFNVKKISRLSWFSFLLSFAFLFLSLKSIRYTEYYSPFLLLFVASGTSDIIKIIKWQKISNIWQDLNWQPKTSLLASLFVFGSLLMSIVYQQILNINIPDAHPRLRYQAASNWLKQNTPKDSIVFHSDWDEWPMLFYFNDHNRYIIGLDFTFMYNYDRQLQQKYSDITRGNVRVNLAKEIKNNYKAEYIFVEKKDHEKLIQALDQDPNLPLLYKDAYFNIYKIEL